MSGEGLVAKIGSARLGQRAREEARAVARGLKRGEMRVVVLENPGQEILDSVIRILISEGVSIFSADNVGDTVRLYVVRR